jgi:PAS domain S-box-containing protein
MRPASPADQTSVQVTPPSIGHDTSATRFHELFDTDADAVLLTNPEGHVWAANPAACELLLLSEDEICARGRRGLADATDPRLPAVAAQRSRVGQFIGELTLVRGDGTSFEALLFTSASFTDDGFIPKTTLVVRDLTEVHAAQVELEEYRERFEELVRERAEEMRQANALLMREAAERRQAEAATRATERRFQALVEGSSDVILIVDEGECIAYASPSIQRLLGYRPEDIAGKSVMSLVHDDDRASVGPVLPGRRSSELAVGLVRVKHLDGSWRWLEWTSTDHLDDGSIGGIVINARDVTERVDAVEALRASEQRYRTLAETSPDMIYVIGADYRVQYVNGRAAQRFGREAKELVGRPLAEFFLGPALPFMQANLRRVFETGKPVESERSYPFPGGELRLTAWLEPMRDDDGNVTAVFGVSRDVTERFATQEALRASEERYRRIVETASEGIVIFDAEWKTTLVNKRLLEMLGFDDRYEPIGKSITDFLFDEDLPDHDRRAALRAGGEADRYQRRLRRQDGTELWTLLSASPLTDADGRFSGSFCMVTDISEQTRANERLRRAVDGTVGAMSAIVETRDPYTAGHERRVAQLAMALAAELGLADTTGLRFAAEIHDIGKISVPAEILSKPSRLTEMEFRLIKDHPRIAYDILSPIDFGGEVAEIVLQHHERLDGSGYPRGLADGDILLEARILAVSDVVEAMASHRPYRPACGIEAALAEIAGGAGRLYDEAVVAACLRIFTTGSFTFAD